MGITRIQPVSVVSRAVEVGDMKEIRGLDVENGWDFITHWGLRLPRFERRNGG